jgi:dTDP-4-amino-4,6-dideoxygalactose transaminase
VSFYNQNLDFAKILKLKLREDTKWNYSYYPVVFQNENSLLKVQTALIAAEVFPRRYFYPSLNTINYTNGAAMPISEKIASIILCLPLYVGIEEDKLKQIVSIINTEAC